MLFDLNRTMFFKAKFDVECDEGDDALWSVIMSLRFWLRGKAEQLGYSMPWGNDAWSSVVRAGGVLRAEGASGEGEPDERGGASCSGAMAGADGRGSAKEVDTRG